MSPRAELVLPGRFQAAVFDVDGLLVDSEPAWAAAEHALLARHGREYTLEDSLASIGRSLAESIAVYARRIGLDKRHESELRAELLALLRLELPAVQAMPGATMLVRSLVGVLPIAVASSSPRLVVDELLATVGLAGSFELILTGDDVANLKPAADIYDLACRRLAIEPEDVVAFEDSAPGTQAAKRAGLYCVAVPVRSEIDVSVADLVLPSLSAVVVRGGPRSVKAQALVSLAECADV